MVFICRCFPAFADTADTDWEKQISTKLAEQAESSEVLWLETNGEKFLALYTRQTSEPAHGAAIILHAMGAHADWPQTISPIRTKLPMHGWTTLSIQLPLIAPGKPIEDYGQTLNRATQRIKTAIQLLRERKFLNIVVIGHSFGGANALTYINAEKEPKIIALALIGLQDYAFVKPPINTLALIEKTRLPILDIYGSRDFKNVIDQAPDRRLAAQKGNHQNFSQYQVDGADHYFNKMEDVLIKRVRSWLHEAAPGVSITVDKDLDSNQGDAGREQPDQ